MVGLPFEVKDEREPGREGSNSIRKVYERQEFSAPAARGAVRATVVPPVSLPRACILRRGGFINDSFWCNLAATSANRNSHL